MMDALVPASRRKQLVLDMDGTLLTNSPLSTTLTKIPVQFVYRGQAVTYPNVVIRPGLFELLETLKEYYDIHVFTASQKEYAEAVLTAIGVKKYLKKVLTRSNCKLEGGRFIKEINRLPYNLGDVILVDDFLNQYLSYPTQTILINTFDGNAEDRELLDLIPFLTRLVNEEDVRPLDLKYDKYLKEINRKSPTKIKYLKSRAILERIPTLEQRVRPTLSEKVKSFIQEKNKNLITNFDEEPGIDPSTIKKLRDRYNKNPPILEELSDEEGTCLTEWITLRKSFKGFLGGMRRELDNVMSSESETLLSSQIAATPLFNARSQNALFN